ncbi:MAG: ankyrin repeat domain-containing protein [Tannerella sp.]|jgi:ankyrin repeat protein|nr:ankyrin repeat domain-containing protein [Tannerella sp.]
MQAIEKHDYKKAEKAICEGSNINEISYSAYPGSPLTYAISKKDLKMVQLLVENGADVNFEPEGRGSDPLNTAIFQKDIAIVTYLLENGADVLQENVKDRSNRPITYAIRVNAGKEIIDMLREYTALQQQAIERQVEN